MEPPLSKEEYLNDNSKLELKVLRALSRLQRKTKCLGKAGGSSVKQVVNHLRNTYALLDGDIETQVTTALLHCVKNGFVCALENNRYLFLGPRARSLVNNCVSRTLHGECCICAKKIGSNCCFLKVTDHEKQHVKKLKKKKKGSTPRLECCEPDIVGTIVCDYCLEIHPGVQKSSKKKFTPSRKSFVVPFDKFSPRDESNHCNDDFVNNGSDISCDAKNSK